MAPLQRSAAATRRPDDRTIAFAISVVLSKPEDVSVPGKAPYTTQHHCMRD